jgi:hypothetical protein
LIISTDSLIIQARQDEVDYKEQFWGPHYPKLLEIKKKYDPNMVFWITPGVNADAMHVGKSGRVCTAGPNHAAVSQSRVAPVPDTNNEPDMSDFDAFFGKLELTGAKFPPPGKFMGIQNVG